MILLQSPVDAVLPGSAGAEGELHSGRSIRASTLPDACLFVRASDRLGQCNSARLEFPMHVRADCGMQTIARNSLLCSFADFVAVEPHQYRQPNLDSGWRECTGSLLRLV